MSLFFLNNVGFGQIAETMLFGTVATASLLPDDSAAAVEVFPATLSFALQFDGFMGRKRFGHPSAFFAAMIPQRQIHWAIDGSEIKNQRMIVMAADPPDEKAMERLGREGDVNPPMRFEDWLQLIRKGDFSLRLALPLDIESSLQPGRPVDLENLLSHFDFNLLHFDFHRSSLAAVLSEIREASRTGKVTRVGSVLEGSLTDGVSQASLSLTVQIEWIRDGEEESYRQSFILPLSTENLPRAQAFLRRLFPGKDYVPDLYQAVQTRLLDNSLFTRALQKQFPAGWVPYDPEAYGRVLASVRGISQWLQLGGPWDLERERKDSGIIAARTIVQHIPWPKPPELYFSESACPVCVGLDQMIHTPVRTLYSLRLSSVPSPEMVRNRLSYFLHQDDRMGGRPDSPLMMEPVALGLSDPKLLQTILEEIQHIKEEARSYIRNLKEVEAYLLGWFFVQTLSDAKILAAWERRAQILQRQWVSTKHIGDDYMSTGTVGLLYAIAHRRLKVAQNSILKLLQRNEYETSYFEWLLTYVLGEIGNEETAAYLVDVLVRPKGNQFQEFIRELLIAIQRIYHRLGKLPEEAMIQKLGVYYREMRVDPNIQLGVQLGSKVQMKNVARLGVDVTQPCRHEGVILAPKGREDDGNRILKALEEGDAAGLLSALTDH